PASFTAEVAVLGVDRDAGEAPQPGRELFGYRDGPVLPSRAAYRDHRVPLVLPLVAGEDRAHRGHVARDELLGAVLFEHVLAHDLVEPGVRAQLGVPERVGEEPR